MASILTECRKVLENSTLRVSIIFNHSSPVQGPFFQRSVQLWDKEISTGRARFATRFLHLSLKYICLNSLKMQPSHFCKLSKGNLALRKLIEYLETTGTECVEAGSRPGRLVFLRKGHVWYKMGQMGLLFLPFPDSIPSSAQTFFTHPTSL